MPAFSSGNVSVFQIDATEGGTLTDISQYVQSVAFKADRKAMKLPVIGGNGVRKLAGPTDGTYTLKGWYDATVGAMFTTYMADTTPTTRSIQYDPQGTLTGLPRQTAEVFITDFSVDTDAESPASFTATLEVDGNVTYATQ